jgi:hypothetical protein
MSETLYSRATGGDETERSIALIWTESGGRAAPVLSLYAKHFGIEESACVCLPEPQSCRDLAAALEEAADRWEEEQA